MRWVDMFSCRSNINNEIVRLGSRKVLDDMVIAIDPGDIRKKYASRMEYLCKVHDGSEHEVGDGYWLCKAVAADIEHKAVIPLYLEAYSQEAHDFKSENDQIFKVIDAVNNHIGMKGIYAVDRGGDRGKLYNKFLEKKKEKRFVIRLTKTRDLVHKGVKKNCREMASALPCPHEAVIIRYEEGKERKITIAYNALPVKLPKPCLSSVPCCCKGVRQRTDDASHKLPGKDKNQGDHLAYH